MKQDEYNALPGTLRAAIWTEANRMLSEPVTLADKPQLATMKRQYQRTIRGRGVPVHLLCLAIASNEDALYRVRLDGLLDSMTA